MSSAKSRPPSITEWKLARDPSLQRLFHHNSNLCAMLFSSHTVEIYTRNGDVSGVKTSLCFMNEKGKINGRGGTFDAFRRVLSRFKLTLPEIFLALIIAPGMLQWIIIRMKLKAYRPTPRVGVTKPIFSLQLFSLFFILRNENTGRSPMWYITFIFDLSNMNVI